MSLRRCLESMVLISTWLLLVAGCSSAPTSGPVPRRASAERMTAQAALGDLRTVAPCTLTDPQGLAQFGKASNAGLVSLDYCVLHVQLANGTLAQLAVGQLSRVDPKQVQGDPAVQRGPMTVLQSAPVPGHCARQILFADRIAMQVNADQLTGDPGLGLCALAQAGADRAVAAIEHRQVRHRKFPPNSLAFVDSCTLVDTAVIRRIPGLEQAVPRPNPSAHQCEWGEHNAESPRVRAINSAGEPPRVLHGAAVEEQIAGRRTVISVVGADPRVPLCSAETAHLPLADAGKHQTEVAMLVVAMPGFDGTDACEYARGLAQRAWPHLPAL